jgi:hypothetical protein
MTSWDANLVLITIAANATQTVNVKPVRSILFSWVQSASLVRLPTASPAQLLTSVSTASRATTGIPPTLSVKGYLSRLLGGSGQL